MSVRWTASWKRAAPAAASSPWATIFVLLVAQDVHERYLTTRMFTTTLPWTVALILVLGAAGGGLMSRNMLRRLDAINRTSGEIIKGDLTRRVPLTGSGDEFDDLAENLNRMLDRIERLLRGPARGHRQRGARPAHAAEPPAQPAGGIGGAAERGRRALFDKYGGRDRARHRRDRPVDRHLQRPAADRRDRCRAPTAPR